MLRIFKHARWYLIGLLLIAVFFSWQLAFGRDNQLLAIAFLDVGQGDSIFIESPAGVQVLIDGGLNKLVLSQLSHVMPFYDREIDLIIGTHPDADHMGGLVEVLRNYEIGIFMDPGLYKDTSFYKEILKQIADKEIKYLKAVSGQRINLGGGASIEILFPNINFSSADSNDYSVIALLSYGENEVLLTGDSPTFIESGIVDVYGDKIQAEILKAGHHGSKTSTNQKFLDTVKPEYAIISAGCDNSYGHPNEEVIERLAESNIEILETCKFGNIVFEGDGKVWRKK